MKTNFKRLFALVLTLCMLASLMVPVAFAEDVAVAPSAKVAETYNVRLVDMTQVDHTTATGWNASFKGSSGYKSTGVKAFNDDGTPSYNTTLTNKIDAAYAAGTLDWKYLESKGEATYREDRMMQLRSSSWVAIQIRVSASGMYALNIATDKNDPAEGASWTNNSKTQSGNVAAYIVPVADFSVENIDAILVDENSVGTVYLSADATSVTFAKQRMEAGEYVVIYDGPTDYSVCEMSLLGDAYEMEEVASYALRPYDMSNTDPATYAGTANEALVTAATHDAGVTTYSYAEYIAFSKVNSTGLGWKYKAISDSNTRNRQSFAYQPVAKTANAKVAVTIDVPESGELYLSLVTDKTVYESTWGNSASKWTGNVTAYLLPAAEYVDLATSANADTCVGTRLLAVDDTTVTFEKTYMEAGSYVLIYSGSATYYPVCEANLSKVAGQELPESEKLSGVIATYDFEIYNNERYAPIFTKEDGTTGGRSFANGAFSGLEGVYEAGTRVETIIAKDYAAGIINFKLKEFNCSSHTFEGDLTDTDYGLRIQKAASTEPASQYMALYLNVPTTALYNVTLDTAYNSVDTLNIYIYDADAEGTVAENMTEANLAATNATSFATVLTAGDNIIVFQIANTTAKDTLRLRSIELKINTEPVTYNFALPQNEAFMNAWYEANGGVETAMPAGGPNLYKWDDTGVTFNPYSAIASAFKSGKMNWALGASSGSNASGYSAAESKNFRAYEDRLRCMMENADATLNYTSFHLNVVEGTYNIAVNYTKTSDSVKVYLFKSPVAYDAYADRLYAGPYVNADGEEIARDESLQLTTYMTDENLVHSSANYKAPEVNFTHTFEESGEYIIVFAPTRTDKNTAMYLSSIVMEPVVYSYVADGVGYNSLEEAVENATDYVFLTENTQVGDLVVPAGVTLDLNGYTLYASSVDASAPGAQIIDAMDGKALIRGDIIFNENNAQLPLYDIDADGYYLFNVDVDSHATTGTGSKTKFWFKVAFSNAKAYDLIGMATELRIVADMTGVYKETTENHTAGDAWAATAKSSAKFVNTWADNNTSYIVVSAVGSGISSFKLNPGVSANGVTIIGENMYKGSAN